MNINFKSSKKNCPLYVDVNEKTSNNDIFIKTSLNFCNVLFLDIDYTLTSDPETSDVKERRFTFYQNNVTQGTVYTKTQLFIASGETKCESLHARIAVVIFPFFTQKTI